MKKSLLLTFLTGSLLYASFPVLAETTIDLDCVKNLEYPARAEFLVERKAVFVHFQSNLAPSEYRVKALKGCLKSAGQQYKGNERLRGGVVVNGFDDTELAETTYIYFDPKTKQVMQEELQAP